MRSSGPGAIVCKSSAYHVQHVVLRATWYEGTAQLLSLTECKSHLFELYFNGWTFNRWRRGGNRSTRRKPLAMSFRKCPKLQPTCAHTRVSYLCAYVLCMSVSLHAYTLKCCIKVISAWSHFVQLGSGRNSSSRESFSLTHYLQIRVSLSATDLQCWLFTPIFQHRHQTQSQQNKTRKWG